MNTRGYPWLHVNTRIYTLFDNRRWRIEYVKEINPVMWCLSFLIDKISEIRNRRKNNTIVKRKKDKLWSTKRYT